MDLAQRWPVDAWAAGATADEQAVRVTGADLLQSWAEPHRHYHDAGHLRQVLGTLDAVLGPEGDPAAVRLAAWFHDAVHAGAPGDDEQASAALAVSVLTRLGVPAARVAEVGRLVRLTATHDPAADDTDGAALCDADLAILAAAPDEYAGYVARVRQEYAHVPDADFRTGRAAVLRRLLGSPRLYRTAVAQPWEPAARRNVTAELRRLEAGE